MNLTWLLKNALFVTALGASTTSLGQAASVNHPIEVSIKGAVLAPGTYSFPSGARLHNASVIGRVSTNAWPMGAALLRQSAVEYQRRLKAGILFDISVNSVHALAEDNAALGALMASLDAKAQAMPVTGRRVAQMNPLQQLIPANNDLLEAGDSLVYPLRPEHVTVTGAVEQECVLSFDAVSQISQYLAQCPRHPLADPSYTFLIQPDGTHRLVGVAHWNAEPANVAVGAVLYVPIKPGALSTETPDLNQELAEFLATQYQLGGRFGE